MTDNTTTPAFDKLVTRLAEDMRGHMVNARHGATTERFTHELARVLIGAGWRPGESTEAWRVKYLETRAALERLQLATGMQAPEPPEPGNITQNAEELRRAGLHFHAQLTQDGQTVDPQPGLYGQPAKYPRTSFLREGALGTWQETPHERMTREAKAAADAQAFLVGNPLRERLIELIDERIQAHAKGVGISADTAEPVTVPPESIHPELALSAHEARRYAARLEEAPWGHQWDDSLPLTLTGCLACSLSLVPIPFLNLSEWELHKVDWKLLRGWTAPCTPENNHNEKPRED